MKTRWNQRTAGRVLGLAVAAATLSGAGAAMADDPAVCEAPHEIDRYELLRRLSLDLRGKPPTIEEYEALDSTDSVPAATVQEYVESPDFKGAMRRYHEAMFWPNVGPIKLRPTSIVITQPKGAPAWLINASGRQKGYRGGPDTDCGGYEQKFFDPAFPGEFRPDPAHVKTDAQGNTQEGYRMVAPYWDLANPIAVCAFDAQESVTGLAKGKKEACNTPAGSTSPDCGCGKNLEYCYPTGTVVDSATKGAMREQLDLLVDDAVSGAAPYTDILLSTKAKVNGPLAQWKRNIAPNYSTNLVFAVPDPKEKILAKAYSDPTWTEVDRGALHAGVLTLPAYLLRFQTNRGRANRFRIDFTCQYFVPPEKLSPAPGCDPSAADITQRCNCQYCHQTLEPLASYFGGFAEGGTTLMTDKTLFPVNDPSCKSANPSGFCGRFYATQPDAHNAGTLLPYQFADAHPEYTDRIAKGPRELAQQIIDDGSFAQCTVKNLFSHFAGRDLRVDGAEIDELDLMGELAKGFAMNGYDMRWLVQQIVSLPQYRRAR
jgi:hypothetical protein